LFDVDARIVLGWDAEMTNIDLWVTEPSGEEAYYGNQLTSAGGQVSNDFAEVTARKNM
jgi:Ca-activated chloride channel homolog